MNMSITVTHNITRILTICGCERLNGLRHANSIASWSGMDNLPDLVKAALTSAGNSGKSLSWKVQENEKRTLIQLVWKPAKSECSPANLVSSVWKNSTTNTKRCSGKLEPSKLDSIPKSKPWGESLLRMLAEMRSGYKPSWTSKNLL